MSKKLSDKANVTRSYALWVRNPWAWVNDRFGEAIRDGKITLTRQQKAYFIELGNLLNARINRMAGKTLSAEENQYIRKLGISIMAAQGVGKDFVTALTMCYILECYPGSKIPCTGLNAQHLRNVLWSEVAKVMALSNVMGDKTVLEHLLVHQSDRIYHKQGEGKTWFAEVITINRSSSRDDQAKTLYGRHAMADNAKGSAALMIVLDEADGIPEPVFGPLEGTMTGPLDFAIMIFNPTRNSGYAYDSHFKPSEKAKWVTLHWSAMDSELVNPEKVEISRTSWGEDSNKFRIRILGLPPISDENTLIPDTWVFDALGKKFELSEFDPVIIGIDVGGGGDKSVCCVRQGGMVKKFEYNNEKDLMRVADWVFEKMCFYNAAVGCVDIVGLGRGVYDRLVDRGARVRPVDSRQTAHRNDIYFNRRSECYMTMREYFQNGLIGLPDDCPDLAEELRCIGFKPEDKNKIQRKEEIRKRLGSSPDSADALALTFAYKDSAFRKQSDTYYNAINYGEMGII